MPVTSYFIHNKVIQHGVFLTFLICLPLNLPVASATQIEPEKDPLGFYGIPWGDSLKDHSELKETDSVDSLRIYTPKTWPPYVQGIRMESVKLYTLEGKYARALFHYHGKATHDSLIQYFESQFGKTENAYGAMMRGLSQHYTWRGPETEITITYHGFRERGVLAVESRILAPLILDSYSHQTY